MAFCSKCGQQVEEGARYCTSCGSLQQTSTRKVSEIDSKNKSSKTRNITIAVCLVLVLIAGGAYGISVYQAQQMAGYNQTSGNPVNSEITEQEDKTKEKKLNENIYFEDFTKAISDNWNTKGYVITKIYPEKGLSLSLQNKFTTGMSIDFRQDAFAPGQNYIVETDIAIDENCDELDCVGFIFTYADEGAVITDRFGHLYLREVRKNNFYVQSDISLIHEWKEVSYTPGEYAHLKVEVNFDTMQVYFNDEWLFETGADYNTQSFHRMQSDDCFRFMLYTYLSDKAYFKKCKGYEIGLVLKKVAIH